MLLILHKNMILQELLPVDIHIHKRVLKTLRLEYITWSTIYLTLLNYLKG